ncbi:ATP-binding protein [Roseibium marinum]|uniref:histidine kinase n=1 Tax=Roseibium marinum TaxID=281252 RepID=A0A2S3ULX7_9HYPH|nr:ATP-binding protein [Roseibium marinum]POF28706.1 signal transduction histidine kinase [Roseibium marinum]
MIKRIWPDTMQHQILMLMVLASLLMVLAGGIASYFVKQAFDSDGWIMESHFVSVAVSKLNETPVQERGDVLADLRREVPDLIIRPVDDKVLAAFGVTGESTRFGPFVTGETLFGMRLEHVVGPREQGVDAPPVLYFRLRDGTLLSAEWGNSGPPPPVFQILLYLFVGFLAVTVWGLMVWAARGLLGPLTELADSAGSFGKTSTSPVPIREYGPREVRTAAQAFNRMQLRINEILEKRTRMLAAISHDLRTPLTRLRLRLDLLEESEIRDRSLEDLDIMDQQITSALTFLRDGASAEPVQRIDVPSFLQSISDKYGDTGRPVKTGYEGNLAVMARGLELERALSDLIDNSIKYASGAEIEASRAGDRIRIDVIDHGQGIPELDRARLLEPFERGDAARQIREGTGFGLGLAISKAIVEAASGTLELRDTEGGGLTVRLEFPAG